MAEIKAKVDYKGINKLIKEMSKNYSVKVGLLAGKGGEQEVSDNMDYAGIGAVMEYGADIKITPKMAYFLKKKAEELGLPKKTSKGDGYVHIPARSWLYAPIIEKSEEFRKKVKEYASTEIEMFKLEKSVSKDLGEKNIDYSNIDFDKLAEAVGASALMCVFEHFENNDWKSNSPFTIADKGSSHPLIGKTSYMKQHITYEVDKNNV